MKKRSSPSSPPCRWFALQILLSISALICIVTLLRIASPTAPKSPPFSVVDDQQAKIAFLFLARSNLPLDFLWDLFFKHAEEDKFSIYIHSAPGFVFDASTTSTQFFYNRQIRNSVQVVWGGSSMIEAERLLLKEALQDSANLRFALISDSCVPLYNFSYIYNYLMSSQKSFVDSFLDKKEGRYNAKMSPIIPKENWRKGSQWIALVRKHAEIVVADSDIYSSFKRFCKRQAASTFGGRRVIKEAAGEEEHDCIPDEHYVQTLLSMNHLEDEIERRTLTYTLWNKSLDAEDKNSWHPVTFDFRDVSRERMMEIRKIDRVNYETESRTEWCQCNARSVPCFLFARKFSRGAAMRMVMDGQVGHVNPASVFPRSEHI